MAVANGSALIITIEGTAIPCQTDTTSSSLERDMIETTCKDSTGSWKTFIPGEKSMTIDYTANLDWSDANGFTDTFTKFDAGTEVAVVWGETNSGGKALSGQGYIASCSPDAPQNDKATYSGTIQITGVVTEITNP